MVLTDDRTAVESREVGFVGSGGMYRIAVVE